jgi:hypothetical protein
MAYSGTMTRGRKSTVMNPAQFAESLRAEGFDEIVTVERPPGGPLDEPPFKARALILDDEIAIEIDGRTEVFRTGQVFRLPAGTPHAERYGPDSVRCLVGRK